jgi:hypothetical protein
VRAVCAERGLLRVGAKQVPLLSGEVHFWRLDPADWDATLRAIAAEGIPIVSTYLSWRRHAPEPDAPFTWRHDERLDVRRFLRLCAAHGLLVQLKPGPWICAEEPNGGYPDWLLADKELLALDASDRPLLGYNPPFLHTVPCYLHPRYLEHARRWIRLVHDEVREFLHPRGPVALIQLDNEPSHCFRDGMYEADYHPACLRAFAEWSGDTSVEPPRAPEAGVEPGSERWRREHQWIRFREWLLAEHVRLLRDAHVEAGATGVAFTVNYNSHLIDGVPQSQRSIRLSTGALGGMDHYYEPPLTTGDLVALARATAFATAAGEAITWSPEIQAGIWRSPGERPAYPDPDAAEQGLYYAAALAFGLQGLNFYMLVNRENWELAPLEPGGAATPMLESVRTVVGLLSELGPTEPERSVALAWHSAYARDAYAAADDATRRRPFDQAILAFDALIRAGYLPCIWNVERAPPYDIPAIVTTAGSYMPRDAQERLARAGAEGVRVVLLGEPPRLDESGRTCEILSSAAHDGHLIVARGVEDLSTALGIACVQPPVYVVNRDGFAVLHTSRSRQLVFVLNPRFERSIFKLRFASQHDKALRSLTGGGAPLPIVDRSADVALEPHAAAVFEVIR